MSNSTSFGLYQSVDIVVNGCYVNNIPDGNYAVLIANNPSNNLEGEAISLELDQPLTIGSTYDITLKASAVQYAGVIQGDLLIGVSTSSGTFGDLVGTASTVENVWNSYSFNFIATSAATHVTVMPVAGISSWNSVDDFAITETCAVTTSTDVIVACDSYTWEDDITYTASNNTATYTLTNAAGCDSIVTLDLTIIPLPNTNVLQSGEILTVDQFADSYQWLDCDNDFAVVNGETNQSFIPDVTGNFAVEVTINGCSDTSICYIVDFTGINELQTGGKELVIIIDFMGRETVFKPNTPLIFIYSDGTQKRVMKLEE
jgi:hypothetical protein